MNINLLLILIPACGNAIYAIVRAWTKTQADGTVKPGWQTSEFWTTVATNVIAVLAAIGLLR